MSIVIFSEANDRHSAIVSAALSQFAQQSITLCADNFPSKQEIGVDLRQNRARLTLDGREVSEVGAIWLRRRGVPNKVPDDISDSDKAIALQESQEFWKAFLNGYFPSARWVNSVFAKQRAQSKIFQLNIARQVGIQIPDTLFSNSPEEIRSFLNTVGKCIFKSLSPVHWENGRNIETLYATSVELTDLPGDVALKSAPGIFQKKIEKEFEVRVTCLGEKLIAAKLISSKHGIPSQDWRMGYYGTLIVEPYELPTDLRARILRFMQVTQLEYAALDLIFSTDKNWYFLEANEAGQFLWLESFNPDIALLKPFCDFLLGHSKWSPHFTLSEIEASAKLGPMSI